MKKARSRPHFDLLLTLTGAPRAHYIKYLLHQVPQQYRLFSTATATDTAIIIPALYRSLLSLLKANLGCRYSVVDIGFAPQLILAPAAVIEKSNTKYKQ